MWFKKFKKFRFASYLYAKRLYDKEQFSNAAAIDPHWALDIAVRRNDYTMVKLLVLNYNVTSVPLATGYLNGYWRSVEAIIDAMHIHKTRHLPESSYQEILIHAVKDNQLSIVKKLLKRGTYVDAGYQYDANTLLHRAVSNDNPDMVKLLLKHGANLAAENKQGRTPICIAYLNGYWRSVEAIIDAAEMPESSYQEILIHAVKDNQLSIVEKLFLKRGGSVNTYKYYDHTLLHHAVINDNSEMVKLLLKYVISPGHNHDRFYPLSPINPKNDQRKTVIKLAKDRKSNSCIKIFQLLETPETLYQQLRLCRSNDHDGMEFFSFQKEKVLAHVLNLEDKKKIAALRSILDPDTSLGEFFRIQRGWRAPSLSRGTLKQAQDALNALETPSSFFKKESALPRELTREVSKSELQARKFEFVRLLSSL